MSGVTKLLVLLSAFLVLDSVQSKQAKITIYSVNDVKSNFQPIKLPSHPLVTWSNISFKKNWKSWKHYFFFFIPKVLKCFLKQTLLRRTIAERTDRPAAFLVLQRSKYIYTYVSIECVASSVAYPDPVGSGLFGSHGSGSGSGKIPDPDPLSTKRPLEF